MTALVLYGTMSGNTEYLSEFVQSGLDKAGYTVFRKNVKEARVPELVEYDLIVLGSSTWDGPKVEGLSGKEQNAAVQGRLQPDMRAFVAEMIKVDLQQKPMAVWGVGHYSYTYTCNAANLLEEAVKAVNGKLIGEPFRVTDVVDLSADSIELWASALRF
jgi:flavodoxin I